MRSKLFVCAAIAVVIVGVCPRLLSEARAANPKGKAADKNKAPDKNDKKSPTELHADDKSMKRQMQWEDKVMGPDSTKADLAKVARAHALNEKAIKDREAQAAREAAAPPPPVVAKTAPKRADVALPSVNDGAATTGNEPNRPHEISSKLATEEAKAPPPAVKPADDKFIDKLLHDEQENHANAKKTGSASDRELEKLLAGANEPRRGRADDVDAILKKRDSGPAMPAPRAPSALPAWTQQPDISPTPAPVIAPPVVASKPQKKNDGVIRVVQGAAGGTIAPTVASASAPARPTRGARAPAARASARPSEWADPFAEPAAVTSVASRDAAPSATARKAPASRPSAGSGWSDPFADKPDTKTQRPTSSAPASSTPAAKRGDKGGEPSAHPAGWKDPFTKVSSPPVPVAMREPTHVESAKWELASRRAVPRASNPEPHVGWGVLKKRAR